MLKLCCYFFSFPTSQQGVGKKEAKERGEVIKDSFKTSSPERVLNKTGAPGCGEGSFCAKKENKLNLLAFFQHEYFFLFALLCDI